MNHGNMFERNQSKKGFSTVYVAHNDTISGIAFEAKALNPKISWKKWLSDATSLYRQQCIVLMSGFKKETTLLLETFFRDCSGNKKWEWKN